MMSRKKPILIISLMMLLLAAGMRYYICNKGPVDVKGDDSIKANAEELYDLYLKNIVAAQKKYTSQILEITGEIYEVSINNKQKKILLFKTGSDGAYAN